jgi:hypothetical protein
MRVASDDGLEACGYKQRVENGDITRVKSSLPGTSPLCFHVKYGLSESPPGATFKTHTSTVSNRRETINNNSEAQWKALTMPSI